MSLNSPKCVIGIDLHGTLLDRQWKIKPDVKPALIEALIAVKAFCMVYVCSGNDLTFIEKYIPKDVRQCFDGFVLETGCVISDGKNEEVVVQEQSVKLIKELEAKLKEKQFKEVKYFARRLATISMFTKTEKAGAAPDAFYHRAKAAVRALGFADTVIVTHSSVAVDIIPTGHNKFSGIGRVAKGLRTIGIADSLNDSNLITDADYAFLPANASPKLFAVLSEAGKKIVPLDKAEGLRKNTVLQSRHNNTEAVVDVLRFIAANS